jgi:UPF0755 protein
VIPLAKKIIALAVMAAIGLILIFIQLYPSGPKETWSGTGIGEVAIEIPAGVNLTEIGRILATAGVVETASFFAIATYDRPEAKLIQPGRYLMALEMGSDQAIDRLLDPKSKLQASVLLQEGLRLSYAVNAIARQLNLDKIEVIQAVEKLESGKLSIQLPVYANGSAEGFLFPATYTFSDNVSVEEVLVDMVKRFVVTERKVDLVKESKRIGFTPREVMTMASLVEAEAFPDDFGRVARVILNRLKAKMPMQFDATVNYALGSNKLLFTPEQFAFDSPYNTYKYPGLPPGPINSPGEAAIRAVLDPADGNWLYFVSTNPDKGITKFTASYAEFLKFRSEFQAWYRENR